MQNILNKIRANGLEPIIEIAAWFDTDAEAREHEAALIKSIGRRNLGEGPLVNMRDRDTGVGRVVRSEEFRAARRRAMIALRRRMDSDPDLSERFLAGNRAAHNTEEYKRRKGAETTSKWADPEHRAERVQRMKAAAAKPERRQMLIETLAKSWSAKDRSASMKRAWARRKNWKYEVGGVVYSRLEDAAVALGVTTSAISYRVRNGTAKKIFETNHA